MSDGENARPSSVGCSIDGTADFVNTYEYDGEGRLIEITESGQSGPSAVAEKEIDLAYNDLGQLVSVTRYLDGDLVVVADYEYDSFGRLVGLVYHQGETILASYAWTYSGYGSSPISDPQSLIPSSWLPNGGLPVLASVGAGQGMLPVHDTTGIPAALFAGTYYTSAAQLTSCTFLDGTVNYSYDPTGQLIGASYTGGQSDEAYSYDANGNRQSANGSTYTTGGDNRLISDGTYTYSYDAEGKRTARFIDMDADGVLDTGDTQITVYGWDVRNRLTSVTTYASFGGDPTQIVEYRYDAENRLIGEKVDSNGDGVVDHQTCFVYDGRQIALQFDGDCPDFAQQNGTVPFTVDANGNPQLTAANLSHRYLWGPAVDQALADEQLSPLPPGEGQGEGFDLSQPGDVVWPLADHLGTVRDLAVYDAQANVTTVANHRVYDTFGNLKSQTNAAVDCLFGFTGRPFDKTTGLQNNTNRWYDAKVGRWVSEDPKGLSAGDPNVSRYCGNVPANSTDPTGLDNAGAMAAMAEARRRREIYEKEQQLVALCNGDAERIRKVNLLLDVLHKARVWGDLSSCSGSWARLRCRRNRPCRSRRR